MIANGKKVQIDSRVYWPGCCADSPTPGASLYIAWVYWLAVVMVAVFGSMSADVTKSCRVFHIRNQLILCNCSRHYLRYPVLDILGKTLPPYCLSLFFTLFLRSWLLSRRSYPLSTSTTLGKAFFHPTCIETSRHTSCGRARK